MSKFNSIQVSLSRFEQDGLRHVTVKSNALGQRADLSLFLPDVLERRLPLVILLHGIYSSHWGWSYCAGAHLTAARLIAEGEIPPLVLAMPSDGLWGDGRRDEDQIGATYKELEWAMDFDGNEADLSPRQQEVLSIYRGFNASNKHKMEPIPVCQIPEDLKA